MSQSLISKNSSFAKPFIIALLILWLQIPMYYIKTLIEERDISKKQATEEVARMAGGAQILTGPLLRVPFVSAPNDIGVRTQETAFLHPHNLKITGKLTTSVRSRGIFEVPVYSAAVTVEGEFLLSDLYAPNVLDGTSLESSAIFAVGVRDLRGLREAGQLAWNEEKREFAPGIPSQTVFESGIQAMVPVNLNQERYKFSMQIDLSGSRTFQMRPLAKSAHVSIASNWRDPSFTGSLIPSERTVDNNGFSAEWGLSDLSMGIPVAWVGKSAQQLKSAIDEVSRASSIEVELLSSIDSHRMSERATKYELLFFFLIFLAFFVFEVLGEVRIHPIQYLMVGAALTLFYLLILSLSEHLGFGIAYLIATALSTMLVSGYSKAILKGAGRTWIIPPLMVSMYGFLYTLLVEEDYALLSGSLGLALLLGVVMYITRNVDWFDFGEARAKVPAAVPADPTSQPLA